MAKLQKQSTVRIDFHPSVNALDDETKKVLRKLTLRDGLMKSILTWEEKIPQQHIPACLAIEGKTIVGWTCLSTDLICVYVLPKRRRQGIGSQLIRAIHGAVKSKKRILQAQIHSTPGKRLFLKMQQELPIRVNFNYSTPTRIAPF